MAMILKISEGIFERDVAMFSDMNPKYVLNFKEEKYESSVCYGGGKNPRWGHEA